MNFRGEILTLIDISHFLNIAPIEINCNSAAMLTTIDELTCGIVVSNICDIFSFDGHKMLDNTSNPKAVTNNYNQGIISYKDKMVNLVDLKGILKVEKAINE
ncbi:MAG: chemotaxis protein CheW [Crocosphaera sp.]